MEECSNEEGLSSLGLTIKMLYQIQSFIIYRLHKSRDFRHVILLMLITLSARGPTISERLTTQ